MLANKCSWGTIIGLCALWTLFAVILFIMGDSRLSINLLFIIFGSEKLRNYWLIIWQMHCKTWSFSMLVGRRSGKSYLSNSDLTGSKLEKLGKSKCLQFIGSKFYTNLGILKMRFAKSIRLTCLKKLQTSLWINK